ncbi:hypothetical protein M9H77_30533 [Catharanthus roseus]|uniref:Uncharacterized protein n=1 Tax=Catharanthus roseus TaxID=4058 RepID=A0ACB9ZYF2_CATRO|nr:hypothetical protein M9H77_30533 [Catharanthus roseus]
MPLSSFSLEALSFFIRALVIGPGFNSSMDVLSHEIDSSLLYHKPFKEFIRKNDISLALSWKHSCAIFLKYEFGVPLLYHLRFKELLQKIVSKRNINNVYQWSFTYLISSTRH